VHAQEQHDGHAVLAPALDASQSGEPLAGEPLRDERKEVGEPRPVGELVVARLEEQLDGLGRERAGELGLENLGRRPQSKTLIGAQRIEVGHGSTIWFNMC
jgi:hypothetical protein